MTERGRLETILNVLFAAKVGDVLAADLLADQESLSDAAFDLVTDHYGRGSGELSNLVLARLIESLVPLRRLSDAKRLGIVLGTAAAPGAVRFVVPSIVDLLIPERARDEEKTYALGFLLAADLEGELRREFVGGLAVAAGRSASYRVGKLTADAYVRWAIFVTEAIAIDPELGEAAAASAIAYAVKRGFDEAFPLVRASFPTAFNAMLRRAKGRRRDVGDMAKEVGRLFVSNRWDGALLAEMLLEVEDCKLAIDAVADVWGGRDLLLRGFARLEAIEAASKDVDTEWETDPSNHRNVSKV